MHAWPLDFYSLSLCGAFRSLSSSEIGLSSQRGKLFTSTNLRRRANQGLGMEETVSHCN